MDLHILGCGEAFDTDLGNASYLLVGPQTILFDCGYQTPERLWRHPYYKKLNAIVFTHFHADHAFGIVPVLMRFWEERRKKPLTLIGPRGLKDYVTKLMNLGYPGRIANLTYDLDFQEARDGLAIGPLKLHFARTEHSVLNLAVRVDAPRARSFAISGDGVPTKQCGKLFQNVGLLIQEVYSDEPGIAVHNDLKSLLKFAHEFGMKRIGITHVSRTKRAAVRKALKTLPRSESELFLLRPGVRIGIR